MVKFKHILLKDIEPFVFPSQVQQVFMLMTDTPHGGRLYLHVEPWNRGVFFDTYGEYTSTNEDGNALDAPYTMLDAPTLPNKIGVILFSRVESLLLNEARQLCVERT
jgi:hypothetical protein